LFNTNLKDHLITAVTGVKLKGDALEAYMSTNWGKVGELLNCPICLAHWVGLIAGFVVSLFMPPDFSVILVLFGAITYPYWVTKFL